MSSEMTDRLFAAARIDRAFQSKGLSKNKHCDNFIKSLNLKMSNDEKKLSSGLFDVVTHISAERAASYGFTPFPLHELEINLGLEAPRKVNAFSAGSKTQALLAAGTTTGAVDNGVKVKRENKFGVGFGSRKRIGNKAFQVGGNKAARQHLADEEAQFVSEETVDYGYAHAAHMSQEGDDDNDNFGGAGAPEQILSSTEIVLPTNFLNVIKGVFEPFWLLEFDDPAVSQAFFANIDNINCKQYGLTAFTDAPMSLSIIRDRMDATEANIGNFGSGYSRAYKSPEDFYSDFRQMFENIFSYYPPQSLPQLKAVELNTLFHEEWDKAKAVFKYK